MLLYPQFNLLTSFSNALRIETAFNHFAAELPQEEEFNLILSIKLAA